MSSSLLNPLLNSLFFYPHSSAKFKEIQQTLSRSDHYTLLIPSATVLEWSVDKESLIPMRDMCLNDDFVASHIIQVSSMTRNYQRTRYFGTINRKTVNIKDGCVHTHKGFKHSIKSRIVKEYVFYPASPYFPFNTQFIVYEIDHPLVGICELSADVSPTVSSRYQLNGVLQSPKQKQENDFSDWSPQAFERMLMNYPGLYRQLMVVVITIVEQFDCSQCTTEDDLTSYFDSAVGTAVSALQACDKSQLSSMATQYELSGDDIANLIYRFVEISVASKLWSQLLLIRKVNDQNTRQAIDNIKNVDISQIGLKETGAGRTQEELFKFDQLVWNATKELEKIKAARGSESKLHILLSVLKILGSGQIESQKAGTTTNLLQGDSKEEKISGTEKIKGTVVSADVLVSLLILVALRSGLDYIDSEVFYIQNFSHQDTQSGQIGYALMTFEAVLFHISSEAERLKKYSTANEQLWDSVKDVSSLESLKNTVRKLKENFSSAEFDTILKSRTKHGDSLLMLSIANKNPKALSYLIESEMFPTEFIIGDTNELGKSLLVAAVQSEENESIAEMLGVLLSLSIEEQREYLARPDYWNRTVGHYFFNASWLIPKISSLIDWNFKDINGQTPLYALCRCYDHQDYQRLLELGLEGWTKSTTNLDTLDHSDSKGNSLLHIVRSEEAVDKIIDLGADINWPNEKGMTPIMIYTKFSRMAEIRSIAKQPMLDLQRTDYRGSRCLDMARDKETAELLDSLVLQRSRPTVDNKRIVISRSRFQDNELKFLIVIKEVGCDQTIISRSINDFQFLQKWLSYENPFSWMPNVRFNRSPYESSIKVSRQIVRELEVRLNAFLRSLLLHPVFGKHELLWEFLVLPEVYQQDIIERSRQKLESRKERQYGEQVSYTRTDLDFILTFLEHARQQVTNMATIIQRLATMAMHLKNKEYDLSDAFRSFHTKLCELDFMKPNTRSIFPELSLTTECYDDYRNELAINLSVLSDSTQSVISAIGVPLNLINQLEDQSHILEELELRHSKGVNKQGWTGLNLFAEKQKKQQQHLQDRIYALHNEVQRLSLDIKSGHIAVASELGGYHEMREKELTHIIEQFGRTMLIREKENHSRLSRALAKFKSSRHVQ